MARDFFQTTITRRTAAGVLEPLADVDVYVYFAGTQDLATANLFTTRTGSGKPNNPIRTGADGRVEFWAEAGDYDWRTVDFLGVNRPGGAIADKTYGWSSIPGANNGIPAALLADLNKADFAAAVQAMLWDVGDVKATSVEYTADVNEPTGWALADGRAVSRAGTYAAYFAKVGTKYGTGDGATTFNLPDYRGRSLVGRAYIRGNESGVAHAEIDDVAKNDLLTASSRRVKHRHNLGSLAVTGAGAHTHQFQGEQFSPGGGGMGPHFNPGAGLDSTFGNTLGGGAHGHAMTGEVGDLSGPINGPAYHVVNYLIKL